ncbi:MAG TPA: hypothetical protein DEB30_05605 [Candidatus Peribacter riflensis]|uniref:Uncharacterized protein n=1 Tax=Candidatus Peribacter riflensis TaxID=1735162 RepID=A0A0S1SIK8_9BACT|nr:MAG: hypothetical protein PeribacterA2_0074 [Candidatus Peribacter riflensis]OGJ77529.1 MAG: hypothetical protein A2398_04030 [Candidatus Peribacteria bacterium RIFOXYB1_FULL_57_12]ALM10572.1 MAG: hypothetical protein PeribacterB2_0074 [Candidatus Peribacter riflensis]ALM11674.1 MAG: hypothetical protein PeribacterC2_0073 [Candidatus Peribacter riflensis]ALM12777.1 MAG: hypothetical protein PeribacterD1_0074 [Candidatus Peribacter riflensis]
MYRMASTFHPEEHSHRHEHGPNGNGNGKSLHSKHVREWLGIEGSLNYYSLLGITPADADIPERVHDAATDRIVQLSALLHEENPDHDEAKSITDAIEKVDKCLSDPERRKRYNQSLFAQHPELVAFYQTHTTRSAVAQNLPEHTVEQKKPLQRIAAWVKKNPLVTGISAAVLAGSGALFMATRPHETAKQSDVSAAVAHMPESETLPPATIEKPAKAPDSTPPIATPVAVNVPSPVAAAPAPEPKPEKPAETPAEPVAVASLPTPATVPAKPEIAPASPAPAQPAEAKTSVEQNPAARLPMPTAEELAPFKDLHKSPTLAELSAREILEQARASRDAAEQCALYRVAEQRARAKGDLDGAMAALREMREVFDDDEVILAEAASVVRDAAGQKNGNVALVMQHAQTVTRDLCDGANFEEAKRFLSRLQGRPSTSKQQLTEATRFVAKLEATYIRQNIAGHLETLEQTPGDPAANRAVGEFSCFERGDWSAAQTAYLRKSDDTALSDLATRADRRAMLSAEELLEFAQELLTAYPAKPGVAALALECCDIGKQKVAGPAVVTRLKDLRLTILQKHGAVLPLALHITPQEGQTGQSTLPVTSIETVDLPGSVNLLSGSPADLMQRSNVLRPAWQVSEVNGAPVLEGKSGHHSWISFIHVPLTKEAQEILRSGKPYTFSFTFSRTEAGRTPDNGSQQGGAAFLVPLPTGRHVGLLWDGNMNADFAKRGMYRSGIYASGSDLFDQRAGNAPFRLHRTQPLIQEDGREYVCQGTITPEGPQVRIVANLIEKARNTVLASATLVAPSTIDSNPYLTKEKDSPPLAGPAVGFGGAGGTMTVRGATLAPLHQRKSR